MKAPILICATGWVVLGCAAKNPAYERQLAKLNENIVILQNERDRLEERIAVLEQRRAERAERGDTRPDAGRTSTRPPLKVVRLRPPTDEGAAPGPAAPPSDGVGVPAGAPAADSTVPVSGPPAPSEPRGETRTLIHGSGTTLNQTELPEEAK